MWRQLGAMIALNLKSLPQRVRGSAVAVIGFAGVVLVLVSMLAIEQGFSAAMRGSGAEEVAFITRSGSQSEIGSVLSRAEVARILESEALGRAGGVTATSREVLAMVNLRKRGAPEVEANVPFRGVESTAFDVHAKVRLVEGRRFSPGVNELLVGRGAQSAYEGLAVGDKVRWGRQTWQVVGVFSSDGDAYESEIWTDAKVLQTAYERGDTYQSVRLRLTSADGFEPVRTALASEPNLGASVQRESDYFAAQSEFQSRFISMAGWVMSALMGLGAMFGAVNTMYGAVAARQREIATLRALGFDRFALLVAVLIEAVLLALAGGLLGAGGAYLAINGVQISTMSVESFSQVVFAFSVTPELMAQGMVLAIVLGLLGGVLPGLRAATLPIHQGIRQL